MNENEGQNPSSEPVRKKPLKKLPKWARITLTVIIAIVMLGILGIGA